MIRLISILFLLLVSCGTPTYTTITPTNPPSVSYWDDIYFSPSGRYISPYNNRWNFYSWRYVPSPPVVIHRGPVVVTPPRPRYYYQSPPRRDRLNRPSTTRPRVYTTPPPRPRNNFQQNNGGGSSKFKEMK